MYYSSYELLASLTTKIWVYFRQAQTWDFVAITFLSAASILTLYNSFSPRKKIQNVSLRLVLIGAFLWIGAILVQNIPLALSEIQKIGRISSLVSFFGLLLALYTSLMWIRSNKHIWVTCTIIGISIMVFFAW